MKGLYPASLVFGLVLGLSALPAQADLIVVPNTTTTADGNSAIVAGVNVRYQQVYASSQFVGPGVIRITEIAFRPDSSFGSSFAPVTDHGVRFDLSTTSGAPNGLSLTFDNNVGSDDTIVFNGDWTRSSANSPGPGNTRAFDVLLGFTTPFTYDPSQGNLLLDIRGPSTDVLFPAAFDAVTASTVTGKIDASPASSVIGAAVGPGEGLVTRFTFKEVPEPNSLTLIGLGGAALLFARRLRR